MLTRLCHESKAHWGYDAAFMAASRAALTVSEAEIAAGGVLVAEQAGAIVGVVTVEAMDAPGTCEIGKLFVAPGVLRQGLGRALMAAAVDLARARGFARMEILADPNAAAFYESLGARFVRDAPSDAIPGRTLPLYDLAL